jgi:hypothetical protein
LNLDVTHWRRFERRSSSLQAMVRSLQSTQKQFAASINPAREATAQFDVLKGQLLPIWQKCTGIDLFVDRRSEFSRSRSVMARKRVKAPVPEPPSASIASPSETPDHAAG